MKSFLNLLVCIGLFTTLAFGGPLGPETIESTIEKLIAEHGEEQSIRAANGVNQVATFWRTSDGDDMAFTDFCTSQFVADPVKLEETFNRFQDNLEVLLGHSHEIGRFWSSPLELNIGQVLPADYLFAEYDPFAHITDDFFSTKLAFVILLNFEHESLKNKLEFGPSWSRAIWARARLAEFIDARVPAEINQLLTQASVQVDDYIANYNIYMHNLLTNDGDRLFPEGLKLISHWGLRDELKSQYAVADGLERQRMIYQVMLRIISQDIPQTVIDNGEVAWNPFTNTVYQDGEEISTTPEPDTRYKQWLAQFHARLKEDPYYPQYKTYIDRRFEVGREIPEAQVEALLDEVLTAPVGKQVAALIAKRLGRDLEPFDIWYDGFKARSGIDEDKLDELVGEKYTSVEDFQQDIPNILEKLEFDTETAQFIGSKIVVDPARGAGHASGAMRRADNAHLRTRVPESGMNYKGYNIAIHELGHNVEQVISLNKMDQYMLEGVPNTAFTEAFAFVFQSRDLALLGQDPGDPMADHLKALDLYWQTCEIAAVSLVDMRAWRWLYEHKEATPAEFKAAVINIATDVWNTYWAPLIGVEDSDILAIYSHLVAYALYTPDYALGHMIMFQIEEYLQGRKLGVEMERMCRIGNVTPDLWMQQAVGSPLSPQPLIKAAEAAVRVVK